MSVSNTQRFTSEKPCPICGGYDGAERGNGSRCYGFVSDDGKYAHCARKEHAGEIELTEGSGTFAHYLGGRCKCGETHDAASLEAPSTNGKAKEKKQAHFDPARDTVFYYRDLSGKPLYAVVRMGGDKEKTFQAHKACGEWWWGIPDDAPMVPYRLPEVIDAIRQGKPVHYFEGETDVEAARKLGLVATTNMRGAGKITEDIVPYFRGGEVVVNGDNDKDGDKHREKVPSMLHGATRSLKVMLPFPGVNDFNDWLKAGGTVEEYLKMVEEAPEFIYLDQASPIPSDSDLNKSLRVYKVSDIKKLNEETGQEEWFCPLFMRPGDITLFGGESKKSGKTTFYAHMLKRVHDGEPFMGMPTIKSGALVLTEQGTNILEATYKAGIKDDDDIYFAFYKDLSKEAWPKVMETAVSTCSNLGVGILVVDTFTAFAKLRHSDENLSGEIIERMEPVLDAARVHGLHVSILHHTGKDGELRGSSAFGKDPDAIWILKRPSSEHGPNVRAMEGTGRYDDINTSFNIELEDDGYVMLGTNNQIERAKAENKWLELVPVGFERHVRRTQVMPVVTRTANVSEPTAKRALERLMEKHVILQKTLREKGSPQVLWRPSFRSATENANDKPGQAQLDKSPANEQKTEGNHLFRSDSQGIEGEIETNKKKPKKKKHHTLLDLARADRELAAEFPNLIYREKQIPAVLEWLSTADTVSVDIETYGTAKLKGERSKLALSFVHGRIRLLQLSDGETTYIVDAALLRSATVATILEALRGKTPDNPRRGFRPTAPQEALWREPHGRGPGGHRGDEPPGAPGGVGR